MSGSNAEAYREEILNKLREAGTSGLTKGMLIGKSRPRAQMLRTLEEERKIANLGTGRSYFYVLKEFDTPEKMAYDRVEALAVSRGNRLMGKTAFIRECGKSCPGKVRNSIEQAIRKLLDERELMELKSGNSLLYLHISAVHSAFPSLGGGPAEKAQSPAVIPPQSESAEKPPFPEKAPSPAIPPQSESAEKAPANEETSAFVPRNESAEESPAFVPRSEPAQPDPPRLTLEQVLEAYQTVRQRVGFSNVQIYKLQQELGAPMEQVKEFLLDEMEKSAVLSMGDWPLATEEIRSGVIYLDGNPYLLVRFEE